MSEITLMTSDKRTAVCCLSSLNLEKWPEWKDSQIVGDLVRLLDNVLEYFIRTAPDSLSRAVYSAKKERSIGIGTLGWHSLLQRLDMPFEKGGMTGSIDLTHEVYGGIKSKAVEASLELAKSRGEAPDVAGSNMRNAHLMAIAPNASSSSLVGVSPSIEPWNANAFNAQGRAGSFLIKNKYLEEVLDKHELNTQEIWRKIITSEGSVQWIDELTGHEKAVFKTANEIDQMWVVEQAAARQEHICQSQSLNIFVDSDTDLSRMSDLHMKGWLLGVKTFYYCRSKPASRAKLGTGKDKPLNSVPAKATYEFDECFSCEG